MSDDIHGLADDRIALDRLTERGLLPPAWSADPAAIGLALRHTTDYASKYFGSLLAGAIGDALGRPAEGKPLEEVRRRFGVLRDFVPWHGWTGGPVGTITDDTQLTMCVADSIVDRGILDPEHLASRFVDWFPHGRGKGRACTEAVLNLRQGVPWYQSGVPSAGNGAAMRAAPIGLFRPTDPEPLRRDAALSAVITHADPTAAASAIAVAFSVAFLLHLPPGSLSPDRYFAGLKAIMTGVNDPPVAERRYEASGEPVRLLDRLLEVGDMLELPSSEAFGRLWNGAFVLESLPAALWCFLRSPEDPEEVLVTAVNGGRDADTVASMAGNMVGAYMGVEALPQRWCDDLEYREELTELAGALLELSGLR